MGILSEGLRIAPPEAPSTGYMFGKGIYFADMASKAAQYVHATAAQPQGLLVLGEVALGNEYVKKSAEYMSRAPTPYHSTKACGQMTTQTEMHLQMDGGIDCPVGIRDGVPDSALKYNEYIIYDESQVRIRFLVFIDFEFQ
jgi:hypothetical protein